LRRLSHRALPVARELRILRGVLADAERMVSLTGGSARRWKIEPDPFFAVGW
jgi:tRNA C32,U32 (ribose-2'-O)-methylase TrmJ